MVAVYDINSFFSINTEQEFKDACLKVFNYQYKNNIVYRKYVDFLNRKPENVKEIVDIPFLPIEFYKYYTITTQTQKQHDLLFVSSGTTSDNNSKHHVFDKDIYKKSLLLGFERMYGKPQEYVFIGLLPSYLERKNASLVYMLNTLMGISKKADNGFYLNEYEQLADLLYRLEQKSQKVILFGVTFALLDLIKVLNNPLNSTIVIATGGMKGHGKELTGIELHDILSEKFEKSNIHGEYGMTELLSQAYSTNGLLYTPQNWMRVLIRNFYDPFMYQNNGKSGGINIIDLANINACSFIETQDIGLLRANNQFEVLGRYDNAEIRGCNLMVL